MMTLEQKRKRVQNALNNELAHLDTTQAQRVHLLESITGGETVERKTKLSLGLVLALVLICISMAALAVNAAINGYYEKVAQLDAEGGMIRWELQDKVNFVNFMREYGLDMNEEDYAQMMDTAKTDAEREVAADRIIQARYGELIRAEVNSWMEQPADLTDIAPSATIIFQERYMAEHPEGMDAKEDYIAYTDALGYYLRDVYYPAYRARVEEIPQPTTVPTGTEEYALQTLKNYMTEVYGWPEAAAEKAAIRWDEGYQLWEVTVEVTEEELADAFEPVTHSPNITETEKGYAFTVLVDQQGNFTADKDKAAFHAAHKDPAPTPVRIITIQEGAEMAKQALQETYGLTVAQVQALFYDSAHYSDVQNGHVTSIYTFRDHYMYNPQKLYGVLIDAAQGKVEEVYSYQPEDLPPKWQLLYFAAQTEQQQSWYVSWTEENKQALIDHMKQCDLLPDHAFWQLAAPTAADMDAFVAEAFEAKGYASAVNARRMVNVLLGEAENWSGRDRELLMELEVKYNLSPSDGLERLDETQKEIGEEEAIRLVKDAFCRAWGLEQEALQDWEIVAQLMHDDFLDRGFVYWRVFLTMPQDGDRAAFHGRTNFDYRVQVDGTLLDAAVLPGWYSPAQEKAVLEEQALYDNETYRLFNRYAQKNGLLFDYPDFIYWPLSHQKACADELRPVILEKMEKGETNDPRLIAFAGHVYGQRQQGMLTEDEARKIAAEQAKKAFGLTDGEAFYIKPQTLLLDVTDGERPFYQVGLSAEEEWTAAVWAGTEPSVYYVMEIDAKTGDVLKTYTYSRDDGETGVEAWDRKY